MVPTLSSTNAEMTLFHSSIDETRGISKFTNRFPMAKIQCDKKYETALFIMTIIVMIIIMTFAA
jgi:hypothetical protein